MNKRKKYFDIYAPVFYPSAVITILFVVFTIIFQEQTEKVFADFRGFMSDNFGWLINIGINYFLLFLIFLAFSKFGNVRIGGNNAKPEFSKFSWVAMLFSAGLGIGLVYFGVAEPMFNFLNPIESGLSDTLKAKYAMKHTFFFWGFHAWSIYCLLGIALAYFCFNRGLPLSLRSTLHPFIGERINGWLGHSIDVLAILGTLFGLATSLGFGAIQFSTGFSLLSGTSNGIPLQIISIVIITFIATLSVLSGLKRGLKYLSNLNIALAILLFFFVLLLGPTALLLDGFVENVGIYISDIFTIGTFSGAYVDSGTWFKGWSMFYWAWWLSWSPFVGTFLARISKGRTIREIVLFALVVPCIFTFLWMSVFGGMALNFQLTGQADVAATVSADSSMGLFLVLQQLPLTTVTSFFSLFLIVTFFVTSSDSGSLVVDFMTTGGKLDSPKGQKVFWTSMEGMIAIALLIGGGLSALQAASISMGFPLLIVLFLVSLSLLKGLRGSNS